MALRGWSSQTITTLYETGSNESCATTRGVSTQSAVASMLRV